MADPVLDQFESVAWMIAQIEQDTLNDLFVGEEVVPTVLCAYRKGSNHGLSSEQALEPIVLHSILDEDEICVLGGFE